MRRIPVLATLLLAAAAIAPAAVAAKDDSQATADHPFVGAWVIDADLTDPSAPDQILLVGPGGILVDAGLDFSSYGAWTPSGDHTADVTFYVAAGDAETGFLGFQTIRSSVEVAEDGQSFSGTYTSEFPAAMLEGSGMAAGEYGPGEVTGQRIDVEPMGEPLGPMPQQGGPEPSAAPEASPAG